MSDHAKKRHYDDLTQIKGIGQATQQWLRETFDVCSYQDLANLSVLELEQALKADGRIPSPSRIEQWLSQATELAAAEPTSNLPFDEDIPTPSRWRRVATFVVVFEGSTTWTGKYLTNVHHMEADVTYSWDRVVKQELGDWIIRQMGAEIAALADADNQPETGVVEAVSAPNTPEPLQTEEAGVDKLARLLISMNALAEQATPEPPPITEKVIPLQSATEANHAEKLQRYVAKVNALSQPPASTPRQNMPTAASQPPHKAMDAEKLQRYVAKVNAHNLQSAAPQQQNILTTPTQPAREANHAEQLQRYVAKVQTHIEQATVKQTTVQPNVSHPVSTQPRSEGASYSEKLQKYADKVKTPTTRYP